MTCEICKWWEWRLADLRISRDKAQQETGDHELFEADVASVKRAFFDHRLANHLEGFEMELSLSREWGRD